MVKLTIEIEDAEFARMLADALTGGNDRAERVLADAGLTPQRADKQPADPWADEPWPDTQDEPAAARASTATRPAARAQTIKVNNPKGPQTWTIGAADAPGCECGDPAAYVEGKTNGKAWRRWACAKGAGDDWRNKCSFSEFIR